jgi:GTP-binding protein
MAKLPVVAIVGRSNVGKSSIFNRILRQRVAVVSDREGVTRDRHFMDTVWNNSAFTIVDTGGYLVDESVDSLAELVREQILIAVHEADVVLLIVDSKTGLTDLDSQFSRLIQKTGTEPILVVNKSETPEDRAENYDFYQLGLGEFHSISAKSGFAVTELLNEVVRRLPVQGLQKDDSSDVRFSILGRPNAGKSTLLNALLGQDIAITSELAGTTRDALDAHFNWHGKRFQITDTAGLRKKAKVSDEVEYFSNMRAIESIRRSDVCVLMVDAMRGVEEQDLRIIRQITDQYKGLVILLSKWDAVPKDHKTLQSMVDWVHKEIPGIEHVPIFSMSCHEGVRVHKVMESVWGVYQRSRQVLGRDNMEDFFKEVLMTHKHAIRASKSIVFKRCCQVMIDPIVIGVECNFPEWVDESWKRYFMRKLRKRFDLDGVPVRLNIVPSLKLRRDEELEYFIENGVSFDDDELDENGEYQAGESRPDGFFYREEDETIVDYSEEPFDSSDAE